MASLSTAEIAHRLKTERRVQGLTQEALARAAGVSADMVIRELEAGVERLRNPVTLARLALALGKPYDWLGAAPPETIREGPGRRLYAARLAKGWTLEQLATAAQMSPSTVHKLEHGQLRGTPRTWGDLGRALEVPISVLRPPEESTRSALEVRRIGEGSRREQHDRERPH